MTDKLTIEGPAGTLEARYDPADGTPTIQAVLCHPHPQYGGSRPSGPFSSPRRWARCRFRHDQRKPPPTW